MELTKEKGPNQRDFLIELERECKVNKPVFIDRNVIRWPQVQKELGVDMEIWSVKEDKFSWAKDLSNDNIVGRYKLAGHNSGVMEFWFDIESNQSLTSVVQVNQYFSDLKKATMQVVEALLTLKIPAECIYIKSSGRGFHVHIFMEGLKDEAQFKSWMEAIVERIGLPKIKGKEYTGRPEIVFGLDATPSIQTVRKIREYGGVNEKLGQNHYCSHVSYAKLTKLKSYPFVLDPNKVEYPKIKVFAATKEFIHALNIIETERATKEFVDHSGPVNYNLDGDPQKLFECPLVRELEKKAKEKKHLRNEERLFLNQLFPFFGKTGETIEHDLISPCSDYTENYTQYQIDNMKSRNCRPITCEWAKKNIGCPADCKGSGGKSPIKFGWQPKTLDQTKAVFRKWLSFKTIDGKEDLEILDIVFAAAADRMLQGFEKCWLFIVARSGGIKTTIIRSLGRLPFIYTIDSLTSKALVSGVVNKHDGKIEPVIGIMKDLDGKTLACKDFTILLTETAEERNKVFGVLRNAYDGNLDKAFGTMNKKVAVNAHFGLIAGSTPVIDNYWNLNQQLGERFLKIRHEIDDNAAMRTSMQFAGQEREMEQEIQNAVYSFFKGIDFAREIEIPNDIKEILFNLAKYTAMMRTPLMTMSQDGGHYTFSGEKEYGTRILKQFIRLTLLLCHIRDKTKATLEEALTVARVALDTPVLYRTKIVAYLHNNKTVNISQAEKAMNSDQFTAERVLNELRHIGVIAIDKTDYQSNFYSFSDAFIDILNALESAIKTVNRAKRHGKLTGNGGEECESGEKRERERQEVSGLLLHYQSLSCDAKKKDHGRARISEDDNALNDEWTQKQLATVGTEDQA
jgi:hypothetical protein